MNEVIEHYDRLIDENNDPVHDDKPLQEYMNKWDGRLFIDELELSKSKSVLEIGVGTGRLAMRVAPLCGKFVGIDISSKTIARASENLKEFDNITLLCDDFLEHKFNEEFDIIYSSLTFMHIKDKQKAISKVASLLNTNGVFMLSIDKNTAQFLDMGDYQIKLYPDKKSDIIECFRVAGLNLKCEIETEFAYIFKGVKCSDG